jgi:mannose-6-phosphate isomerase-like protein (cupin superfamily)
VVRPRSRDVRAGDAVTAPLGPGEGRILEVFDATLTLKATGETTRGAYSLLEGRFTPGGFAPVAHRHREQEEAFFVVDGAFDFQVDGRTFRGDPGAYVLVPRGTMHGFVPVGSEPARLLVLHSPALDPFFLELAELSRVSGRDPAAMRALMERWGMDL